MNTPSSQPTNPSSQPINPVISADQSVIPAKAGIHNAPHPTRITLRKKTEFIKIKMTSSPQALMPFAFQGQTTPAEPSALTLRPDALGELCRTGLAICRDLFHGWPLAHQCQIVAHGVVSHHVFTVNRLGSHANHRQMNGGSTIGHRELLARDVR